MNLYNQMLYTMIADQNQWKQMADEINDREVYEQK